MDTLVGLGAGVLTFMFTAGIPVWFPAYKNNGKARPGVPEPVRFKCKVHRQQAQMWHNQ